MTFHRLHMYMSMYIQYMEYGVSRIFGLYLPLRVLIDTARLAKNNMDTSGTMDKVVC